MKLTFWGADKVVTGSMHHIETGDKNYLLDCGLYQGRRQEAFAKNSQFPFPASSIAAVLLSHAHIDHSGNLPGLVKNGFTGPIYTTPATVDLCVAMLADSAFLQEKDAEFVNRRREHRKAIGRDDRPVTPLYTREDAQRSFQQFRAVPLGERKEVGPGLFYKTYDAGHMLGSSSMIAWAFPATSAAPASPSSATPNPSTKSTTSSSKAPTETASTNR